MNLADIKAEKPKRTRDKKFYFKTLSHKPSILCFTLGQIRKKLILWALLWEDYIWTHITGRELPEHL